MLTPFYDFADTFRVFDALAREVNRVSPRADRAKNDAAPAFDVYEKEDAYVFVAELPGVLKEDLAITVEGDIVEIAAKREAAAPDGYEIRARERQAFSFDRKWKLGARLDATIASAALENGVLTLTLPKAPETKPQKIAITTAAS